MAPRRTTAPKQTIEPSKKRGLQDDARPPAKRVKAPTSTLVDLSKKKIGRGVDLRSPAPSLNNTPTARLEVFAFGDGSSGALGLGTKDVDEVSQPRLNQKLDPKSVGVVSLAAGGMHAAAVTYDNRILTWGVNDNGALGRDTSWDGGMREVNGEETDSDSAGSESDLNPREANPAAVPADAFPPGTQFVQVAAGDSATFCLTDTGRVYGWGTFRDSNGIFGFYLTSDSRVITLQREPMLIPDLKKIVQLSAGSDFCVALDAEGSVFSWGNGEQCQLGRRLVERRRMAALRPTQVALPKRKIVSVHTGSDHAFAIDSDGNTWAWGSNNFGQTGVRIGAGLSGSIVTAPQKVASLVGRKMKMIQGGLHHSIGITESGECLAWGRLDACQSGLDLSKLPLDDPGQVMLSYARPRILLRPTRLSLSGCTYIAAGSDHNVAITSDGKAYSWGFNATAQCGQNTDEDIETPTLIQNPEINDKKFCWAGAGGQYSMLACPWKGVDSNTLTNGIYAS